MYAFSPPGRSSSEAELEGHSYLAKRTPLPENRLGPKYKDKKPSKKQHVTPLPKNEMHTSEPENRYHKMRSLMDKGLD